MQLAEAEMIEVEFRGDAMDRMAAGRAFETQVLPPIRRWAPIGHEVLVAGLAGLGVGLFLGCVAGSAPNVAGFLGFMAAVAIWALGRWHQTALEHWLMNEIDTGGWGRIVNRFDPTGFEAVDDLRRWRTDWRGVADVALTSNGLAVATQGGVFVLPANSWDSRDAMEADTARIRDWWLGANGRLG